MMKEKAKIFKALSDPNRLRIIKMLQTRHLCVCEITEVLGLATSTVSKHLSVLKDVGFISEEKDGKWVNYKINPKPFDQRISSILTSLSFWISDDKVINKDKKKLKSVSRYEICKR